MMPGAVGAQTGADAGGFELLMNGLHVSAGSVETDDAAGIFGHGVGVKDCEILLPQGWNQPGSLAKQLGGDVVDSDFQHKFNRRVQAHQAQEIVRADFKSLRVGFVFDALLRDVFRAIDVVPAEDRRAHGREKVFANVQNSGCAGPQKPFVRVSGQEIDILNSGWKRPERLNAVHTEEDAPIPQLLAYGREFEPVTADEVIGRQRHKPRLFINLANDINGSDLPQTARVDQAYLDAALGERHPRVNIRRIVVEVDQDIIAPAEVYAGGYVAQRQRGWADKSDLARAGPNQASHQFPALVDLKRGQKRFLIAKRGLLRVVTDGLAHPSRQRTNARMRKKGPLRRHRKFMSAKLFIR